MPHNVIAQAAADVAVSSSGYNALVIYGPMGIMLAWFAWRAENRLDDIVSSVRKLGHRIDGVTRAMLVEVVSRPDGNHKSKQIAQDLLEDIERGDADEESSSVKKRRFTIR
jgi:hypothetical protein